MGLWNSVVGITFSCDTICMTKNIEKSDKVLKSSSISNNYIYLSNHHKTAAKLI